MFVLLLLLLSPPLPPLHHYKSPIKQTGIGHIFLATFVLLILVFVMVKYYRKSGIEAVKSDVIKKPNPPPPQLTEVLSCANHYLC